MFIFFMIWKKVFKTLDLQNKPDTNSVSLKAIYSRN